MNYRKLSAFLLSLIIYTIVLFVIYKIVDNMHLATIYGDKKIKISLKNSPTKIKPIPKKITKPIIKKKQKAKIAKAEKKSSIEKLPKKRETIKQVKKIIKAVPQPTASKKNISSYVEKKRAPIISKSSPKKSIYKKDIVKKTSLQKKIITKKELNKYFKREHNTTIKKKIKSPLYNSILALPRQQEKKKKKIKPKNLIGQPIEKLYGDDFNKMSKYQRDYILNNAGMMQQITQKVLNRVGRINIPSQMHFNSSNIVEFKLYPGGDISDITLLSSAGFKILDETTKETIEYAYKDYPHPQEIITVRFIVGYYLMGY